ncbi:MAG: hypothetical protein Q8873_08965, partial [Bacillota bacterium]|nr:hypothetical protein [Bacillota bacterium]
TVSAGSRYAQGEQVTITATPATGYSFVYWEATNGTISNTSSSSATYTVGNSNAVITAHFSIKTYAINVSVSGDEGGTITPTAYVVNYGEGVSVTLNPYPGYTVSAFTVGGKDKLSSLVNNVYTLTGIKSTQSMVVTYSWTGLDIISGITALRAYDAQYSNSSRTITVKATNANSTAGFALDLEGSYFAETGKNLSSETKDGKIYIVVPIAAGENQTFKLYINYGNCPYVYTVFFSFTDDPDLAITDIVSYNGYSVDLDPINYTVNLTVDRWLKENVGFKFILPQGVSASYELIYSLDGGTEMSEISTSDYIDTKGASGAYGAQTLFVVPRSNGLIQQIKVTLSDGNITNEYILKISFNDCSFAGDIRPTTLVPLRLTYYKMDTKNKTIYAEASKSSVTSGFSFTVDGNPPKRYSAESGCNLVVGVKDGYKYIINRRVFGTKQTYKVKIYGNDCYEYSWYTVTIKYV